MPKLEPKQIQSELERGQFRTVYFLYGLESMKMRELSKRISRTYLGKRDAESSGDDVEKTDGFSEYFGEVHFDGSQTSSHAVLEEMMSLSLGVSEKVILVKNAHQMKDLETLVDRAPQMTFSAGKKESAILICWAKDLDQRKKSTKLLMEKSAVIPCEVIAEKDRAPWIRYLMKRRPSFGMNQTDAPNMSHDWLVDELLSLEPWTLDIVDQALEQFELTPEEWREDAFLRNTKKTSQELFIQAFLKKDFPSALFHLTEFANAPEESLPLLGLLAWNFRMLTSQKLGTHAGRSMSGHLKEKFKDAIAVWTPEAILSFQKKLTAFDISLKGSGEDPRAAWVNFCRNCLVS